MQDVEDGRVNPSLREIPDPGPAAERYLINTGDVLLTGRGTSVRSALADAQTAGSIASSSIIVIRPGPGLRGPVLLTFLQDGQGERELQNRIRGSTTTAVLTLKDVLELPVPVPPEAIQDQLAQLAAAVDRSYEAALRAACRRRKLGRVVMVHLLEGGEPPAGGQS